MEESWIAIDGDNGLYLVSNTEKDKSLQWNHSNREKELSQYEQGGYKLVGIRKNGVHHNYLVHRLVAKAFVENPRGLDIVNHIDGDKSNNNYTNLEWVTCSENTRHAIRMGLRPAICSVERKRGKESPLCKKVDQFSQDGTLIKHWETTFDIEEVLGYRRQSVIRCCLGYRKTYKGFMWRYCQEAVSPKQKL